MTRDEHIAWCKKRALEYVDIGDPANAYASLVSDLRKHSETSDHAALELGAMLLVAGHLSTTQQMREWIEGCR
jgi:hypothetical protein